MVQAIEKGLRSSEISIFDTGLTDSQSESVGPDTLGTKITLTVYTCPNVSLASGFGEDTII